MHMRHYGYCFDVDVTVRRHYHFALLHIPNHNVCCLKSAVVLVLSFIWNYSNRHFCCSKSRVSICLYVLQAKARYVIWVYLNYHFCSLVILFSPILYDTICCQCWGSIWWIISPDGYFSSEDGTQPEPEPESSDCVRSKEAKPPRLHWFLFGDNFPGFLVRQVELGHEPPGYYRSEGHEILGPDLESTGMIESTQIPVDSTVGQKLKLHPSQPETPSTAI